MRRLMSLFAVGFAAAAAAQAPAPRVAPVTKAPLIVQGGLTPPGCEGGPGVASTGAVAIGPKQDDPAPRPSNIAGRGALAIGPKQDGPAPPPPQWATTAGRAGGLAIGPKQDDPAPKPPTPRCTPAAH